MLPFTLDNVTCPLDIVKVPPVSEEAKPKLYDVALIVPDTLKLPLVISSAPKLWAGFIEYK